MLHLRFEDGRYLEVPRKGFPGICEPEARVRHFRYGVCEEVTDSCYSYKQFLR